MVRLHKARTNTWGSTTKQKWWISEQMGASNRITVIVIIIVDYYFIQPLRLCYRFLQMWLAIVTSGTNMWTITWFSHCSSTLPFSLIFCIPPLLMPILTMHRYISLCRKKLFNQDGYVHPCAKSNGTLFSDIDINEFTSVLHKYKTPVTKCCILTCCWVNLVSIRYLIVKIMPEKHACSPDFSMSDSPYIFQLFESKLNCAALQGDKF